MTMALHTSANDLAFEEIETHLSDLDPLSEEERGGSVSLSNFHEARKRCSEDEIPATAEVGQIFSTMAHDCGFLRFGSRHR